MKKQFVYIAALTIVVAGLCTPLNAHATEPEAGSAGTLATFQPKQEDARIKRLQQFFHEMNSPFEQEAAEFVIAADANNLDWRLVAAIAGLESTFGKYIPTGSHNAWGWGIPTGQPSGIAFGSWKEGINTVSTGLRTNYIEKGRVGLEDIGHTYAASPTWAVRVQLFMDKITSFVPVNRESLDVSL